MLALAAAALTLASPKTKLVNVVWDGAADWIIDDMLAKSELPNVARLKENGICAESVIPGWPSKTAVGHAALFTSAWANVNGISNNTVGLLPRADHDLTESCRGFDGNALMAEPIWVAVAKSGRKVVACSAACSFPVEPFIAQIQKAGGNPKNFIEFSGFEQTWQEGRMFGAPVHGNTWNFVVAGREFRGTLLDDPDNATVGYDTVEISSQGVTTRLTPVEASEDLGNWSPPFTIQKEGSTANVYFRLWSLKPDGRAMELYQRKVSPLYGTEAEGTIREYVMNYGGFHDDAWGAYEKGIFGKTISQRGDGTAEKRILEIVRQDCQFLKQGFAFAWKKWRPDLLMHYTPMSDSAGHTLVGGIDPDTAQDPVLAEKLLAVYKKVYQLQDDWLGFILDTVGKNTVVSLTSDHGMAGARHYLALNNVLEKAGLCVRDAQNRVDWSKSKAAIPNWSDFFVVVNTLDRKGGIVSRFDRDEVLKQVRKALLDARDDNGEPVVTGVFQPDQMQGLGLGGPTGGDLYFEVAPGLYPSNRFSNSLLSPYGNEIGGGVHGFMPYRRKMGAIFYAAGPGLERGRQLPVIRHIDVFPTLCKATGLPVPKDAVGIGY